MSNRPSYARRLRSGGMRLPAKIRAAWPTRVAILRRLEGEMSRLRRLVGNLLDMVEDGGGREVKERLKGREGGCYACTHPVGNYS